MAVVVCMLKKKYFNVQRWVKLGAIDGCSLVHLG